jgi:hypothetical protein
MDFFACLKDRKFSGRKHTTGDKPQTGLFVFFFGVDKSTYGTFNQFNCPIRIHTLQILKIEWKADNL